MVETLALVFLWQALPIELGCLKEGQCAHHICLCKCERILDTSVYMALSCKMNDAVNVLILHQLIECIKVTNVHLHKLVVWLVFYILKACQVACIGQLGKADDFIFRYLLTNKRTM